MRTPRNVTVFQRGDDQPLRKITPNQARHLVSRGNAEVIGEFAIRLTGRREEYRSNGKKRYFKGLGQRKVIVAETGSQVEARVAEEWIERGLAEVAGELAIRMVPHIPVAASSDRIRQTRQGEAYESAAKEKHLRYVQGGLTRHEHSPRKFERWHGAKVGHQ